MAPSGARSPAPGLRRPRLVRPRPRLLLVHTFGAPAPPRVKPWCAPRYCQAAYCDSDEGVRPVGHSQRASPGTAAPTERHLQVTRRPPLASRPGPVSTRRRTGARIRTPHGQPPARAWLRRRAELAPWPPPEALPPCALRADPTRLPHTICSGTMSACENGGPPPLLFSGGEERPPPFWEVALPFGRGGGLLGGGPPFWEGRRSLLPSRKQEGRRASVFAGAHCAGTYSMGQPRQVSTQSARWQGLWRRPGRQLRTPTEPSPGRRLAVGRPYPGAGAPSRRDGPGA